MIVFILLTIVWLGLGWIGAAYAYNYFQSAWPEQAAYTEADDARNFWFIPAGAIILLSAVTFNSGAMREFGPRFTRYKYIDGVRQP